MLVLLVLLLLLPLLLVMPLLLRPPLLPPLPCMRRAVRYYIVFMCHFFCLSAHAHEHAHEPQTELHHTTNELTTQVHLNFKYGAAQSLSTTSQPHSTSLLLLVLYALQHVR